MHIAHVLGGAVTLGLVAGDLTGRGCSCWHRHAVGALAMQPWPVGGDRGRLCRYGTFMGVQTKSLLRGVEQL